MTEPRPNVVLHRARRIVRMALGLLAVGLLVSAVVAERAETADALRRLSPGAMATAFALVLVGLSANMLSWRQMLEGLGSPLPVPVAARVFLVAQIGKYLPGTVWPLVAQVELGREHGVPRLRSAVAGLAALLVGMVVGIIVALVCLVPARGDVGGWWVVAIPLLPGSLLLLHPRVIEHLTRLALKLTRRPAEPISVRGSSVRRSAAWSLVMWLALGAHVWVLARSLGAQSDQLFLLSVGAYAAAWVTGLLVVVAPAGAGAREAALVLALVPALSRGDALALAVVSRLLTLLGDGTSGGAALLARRLHPRSRNERSGRATPL